MRPASGLRSGVRAWGREGRGSPCLGASGLGLRAEGPRPRTMDHGCPLPRSCQYPLGEPRAVSRQGMATLVVFFVVILLGILVFAYFGYMRGRRLLSYKQIYGEYARALAVSSVDLARAHLRGALLMDDSTIRRALLSPLADLSPGADGRIVLETIDIAGLFPGLVDRMLEALGLDPDDLQELTATYYLRGEELESFPDLALGSSDAPVAVGGDREKMGRLFLEVISSIGGGPLQAGVTRRLVGFSEFRVVSPVPPVLSLFTLYIEKTRGESGDKPLNQTKVGYDGTVEGGVPPLIISNGQVMTRGEAVGRLDAGFLQKQGWIYLGGDDVTLNLAFSRDETPSALQAGEDFHFYQGDPTKPQAQRAYADEEANRELPDDYFQIRYWDMGVQDLQAPQLASYRPAFEKIPEARLRSSTLHLFGRPPYAVSPTLVFGKVDAGFLRLSAANPHRESDPSLFPIYFTILTNAGDNPDLGALRDALPRMGGGPDLERLAGNPFLGGKFLFLTRPGVGLRAADSPRIPAGAYARIQSNLASRPYNQSLLFLKTGGIKADPLAEGTNLGLPEGLFRGGSDDARTRLTGTVLSSEDQDLAGLSLPGLLGDVAFEYPGDRACRRFSPQGQSLKDFLEKNQYLKAGQLNLETILVAEGPVVVPPIDGIQRGGVLAGTDLEVEGRVDRGAGTGNFLTFVATGEKLVVKTQQRLFASLMAPRGTLSAPSGMDAFGSVAVEELELAPEGAGGASYLSYEPALKARPGSAGGPALVIDVEDALTMYQ